MFYYVFVVLVNSGCTLISIKDIPNADISNVSKTMSGELINISVIRDNRKNEDISKTKPGQQIIKDLKTIESSLRKKGIVNILVKVSVAKDLTGACSNCLFLWPEFITGHIQVDWYQVSGGAEVKLYSKKTEYKMYSHILLFPYSVYDIISRIFKGEWDSGFDLGNNLISTKRELAAASSNRQMVKEVIENNFEIPYQK